MITVRVCCTSDLTAAVVDVFEAIPTLSTLAVLEGALRRPPGDIVEADVARESANTVVEALHDLGVPREGSIQLLPVATYVSRSGLTAEERAPIDEADAVVWAEVVERAYSDSRVTWTFLSFMILATLLAAIAIITDSAILVIGAMVLGPEFVAVAALGLGLVRRRPHLFRQALRSLAIGFGVAIAVTAAVAALAGLAGVPDVGAIDPALRPGTGFIYYPNGWSLTIALIAGAAGVLALTSARSGALVGVFISVTTIPAAGSIALSLAFAQWTEFRASTLTLVLNIAGMALAGWATLALQQLVLSRSRARRARRRPVPR